MLELVRRGMRQYRTYEYIYIPHVRRNRFVTNDDNAGIGFLFLDSLSSCKRCSTTADEDVRLGGSLDNSDGVFNFVNQRGSMIGMAMLLLGCRR